MKNLAASKGANESLVLAMNDKLNAAVDREIGKDDGREMPDVQGIAWAVTRVDL